MMQEPGKGGKWHLCGEALSQDGEAAASPESVVLVSASDVEIAAEVEDAEFVFPPIDAGTYSLKFVYDDHDVLIDELVVGS